MVNIQERSRRKFNLSPRVRAWIAIVVLAVVCVFLGRGAWRIYGKNELAENSKKATLRALDELKQRERDAEANLSKINTAEGVEEEIRAALPVAKEGEHVITILEEKAGADEATSSQKAGFWASLLKGL